MTGEPGQPTVIYDGNCSFCMAWVERLRRWDSRGEILFLPLQDPRATELSGRGGAELKAVMHFVAPDGEVFRAAAAVAEALGHTRWRLAVKTVSVVPGLMRLAEMIYLKVAANRYTFGCEEGNCSIEFEEEMMNQPDPSDVSDAGEAKPPVGPLEEDVRAALRSVKDPEIDMNIVDLGLVYNIENIDGKVYVQMTLTSPGCPAGPEIVADVDRCVGAMDGVRSVDVEIVWEPFWTPDLIDPRIRAFLGM